MVQKDTDNASGGAKHSLVWTKKEKETVEVSYGGYEGKLPETMISSSIIGGNQFIISKNKSKLDHN